jgi:Sulfotransferase family
MLSVDQLLADARQRCGLEDFGSMVFAEGLAVLVHAINTEAGLTVANEARVRDELLRSLVNRLRMRRDILRHPEILEQEILPPVFITSLPRTGSTKLHRMLAASRDFNAMKFWQAYNFARFPHNFGNEADARIEAARGYLEWAAQRSPLCMEAHPMYVDDAEEELFLLDAGFNSLYWHAAHFNVPGYVEWVLKLDARQAFGDVRRILQYMQWQHFPGAHRRWVLKSPAVLGREAAFAEVFPGADFIVTHRHPEQVVASGCAAFSGVRQLFNDQDYADVAGDYVLYSFGETIRQHLQWRATYPADKVLDIRFDDIIHNEFALLPRIYRFLAMPWHDSIRDQVQAWIAMDSARRLPARKFQLADYGLSAARVVERFDGYIQRYADCL